MIKLKNLLQSDASNFIHLGIIVLLFYISRTTYLGYILLVPELIFLFKRSKNILVYSLIVILVLNIRFIQKDARAGTIDFPVIGTVSEVFDNGFYLMSDSKILCYYSSAESIYPGMQVEVQGTIVNTNTYNIVHTFDYEQYLRSKNIDNVISVNNIEYHQSNFNIYIVKYKVTEYINNNFNEQTASYLRLFILGEIMMNI